MSLNEAKKMEDRIKLRQIMVQVNETVRENPETQQRKRELASELGELKESDLRRTCTI